MNKLIKGSIAGAAGIALLLNGAGTFALWNDNAAIANGSVSSGKLTLSESTGSWSASTDIVPGDVVTYTDILTITAEGPNLKATLSFDEGSITGGSDLPAALNVVFTATGLSAGTAANTYEIPAGTGTHTVPVQVTVTFDEAAGNLTQDENITLEGIEFVLQQHR